MAVLSNTMMQGTSAVSDDGFTIEKSLRFDFQDRSILSRTGAFLGNRRKWTWAGWIKRDDPAEANDGHPSIFHVYQGAGDRGNLFFDSTADSFKLYVADGSAVKANVETTGKIRDPGAWMHIMMIWDTSNEVEKDRVRMFINGHPQVISGTFPALNYEGPWNKVATSTWGPHGVGGGQEEIKVYPANAPLADVYFIDGMALGPAAFGEYDSSGCFNPKEFNLPAPNKGVTHSSTLTSSSGWNSGAVGDLFDGVASEATSINPTSGHTATWLPAAEITGQLFEIYCKVEDSSAADHLTVNGINYFADVYNQLGNNTFGWATLYGLRSINTTQGLTFKRTDGNKQCAPSAIRVDGVILVDGQTDPSLTTNPHNGTVWSRYCTSTSGGTTPGSFETLFSGSGGIAVGEDSYKTKPSSDGHTCTFIPPSTITGTKIEIRAYCEGTKSATNLLEVNGTSKYEAVQSAGGNANAAFRWVDVGTSIDATDGVKWGRQNATNETCITAIRVDGHILRDACQSDGGGRNGFHLKFDDTTRLGRNYFNQKSVSEATGALPIYNTTADSDGYDDGSVKGSGNRTDSDSSDLKIALPLYNNLDDESGNNRDGTITGTTVAVTDQSRLYGGSYYFPGTGNTSSYISIADCAELDFQGAWTIEYWVRFKRAPGTQDSPCASATDYKRPGMFRLTGGQMGYFSSSNGSAWDQIIGDGAATGVGKHVLAKDTWYHIAFQYDGSSKFTAYVNGVKDLDYTTSATGNANNASEAYTLGRWGTAYGFQGWLQDFRIYGKVKYSSAFTPPTRLDFEPYNLETTSYDSFAPAGPIYKSANKADGYAPDSLKQYLRFACPCNEGDGTLDMNDYHATIKGSGSNHTITASGWTTHSASSSIGWGHSGDNNSNQATAQSSEFEIKPNEDFCLEFWTYIPTSGLTTHARIFNFGDDSTNNIGAAVYSGGEIYPMVLGDYIITGGSGTNLTDTAWRDAWAHWAFTRENGIVRWFLNGVLKGEEANVNGMGSTYNTMRISGANHQTEIRYHDIRYYIGTSKYNANGFTPSRLIDHVIQDSTVDTPTNGGTDTGKGHEVTGNYCTLNPLASTGSMSYGNLESSTSSTTNYGSFKIPSTGKWYWECAPDAAAVNIGIAAYKTSAAQVYLITDSCLYSTGGVKNVDGVLNASYGSASGAGDVIGIAMDADNDVMEFYKNNSSMGTISHGVGGRFPVVGDGNVAQTSRVNFGQHPFKYTAPAGYKCLCTANHDDTFSGDELNNPSKYFDIKTYTGLGADQNIKGLAFQPDLTWIKQRNGTGSHRIHDAARGAGKMLASDGNAAEYNDTAEFSAFLSDGFTLDGTGSSYNTGGNTYVSWNWDCGTAAATASTDGDITPDAQWVNATAGFSISKFEGSATTPKTIGHGLSAVPEFIILKNIDRAVDWVCYHKALGNTQAQELNQNTAAEAADSGFWHNTTPTNTVFTTGNGHGYRTGGIVETFLAYCWTPIDGYSAFGSFTGNESTNGPMINCGFRPRYVMLKDSVNANDWYVFDTERLKYNPIVEPLYPNGNHAEQGDSRPVDILSNGFKIRNASYFNANGDKILWCAFAEHPFKTARAR